MTHPTTRVFVMVAFLIIPYRTQSARANIWAAALRFVLAFASVYESEDYFGGHFRHPQPPCVAEDLETSGMFSELLPGNGDTLKANEYPKVQQSVEIMNTTEVSPLCHHTQTHKHIRSHIVIGQKNTAGQHIYYGFYPKRFKPETKATRYYRSCVKRARKTV